MNMNIIDTLFSAGGGGIVGSVLSLGTNWVQHKQKMEEMRVGAELAEKTEAWKAFTASLASDSGLDKLPANTWAPVASLYVAIEAFRRFTRPGLTWAGLAILVASFWFPNISTEERQAISFGTWTAIFWWFGSRYQSQRK
jgi:hypothetical protein